MRCIARHLLGPGLCTSHLRALTCHDGICGGRPLCEHRKQHLLGGRVALEAKAVHLKGRPVHARHDVRLVCVRAMRWLRVLANGPNQRLKQHAPFVVHAQARPRTRRLERSEKRGTVEGVLAARHVERHSVAQQQRVALASHYEPHVRAQNETPRASFSECAHHRRGEGLEDAPKDGINDACEARGEGNV